MTSVFSGNLFQGKTAFFAGGTSGIGLAIAQRFGALGAEVALFGRSREKLDAALASFSTRAIGAIGDVRDYNSVQDALASAPLVRHSQRKRGATDRLSLRGNRRRSSTLPVSGSG